MIAGVALGQDASHPGAGNRSLEGQHAFIEMIRTNPDSDFGISKTP